ncbi:30S ribosomal protein S6 [Candidatus Gracilibacteria bacterium]|nr:MAG: 30S ribosomal protein S6 [Candidatus Gracilibacteria bacterium]
MRQYELMMIIDPALSKDDSAALIKEIETELKNSGAKIKTKDHPGEQNLAYKIRGSKIGYYLLYTLERNEGDFFDATRHFNMKPSIWRFMFVRTDNQ